jgi:hypothetical protein
MGHKPSCLPCASEAQYGESVDDPAQDRPYLRAMLRRHPELCPKAMAQGFTFPDGDVSIHQDRIVRRLPWPAPGAVCARRPSFVMPAMLGRTAEIDKALSLRQWGVPCAALAYVLGRDAMFWSRAWRACGRLSLVGTTVQEPPKLPRDLVADAQLPRGATPQVDVPPTVGGGCFLGVSVGEAADTVTLERGDGACAKAAKALVPA